MRKSYGFTIVEVIIVCIVIGILASVVIIGWSGTMMGSKDDVRANEQHAWVSRFETFRNRYSVYPNSATSDNSTALNGRYCLGIKFPSNQCAGGGITTATNDALPNQLMQDLAKVGTLPDFTHETAQGYTGPWADYTNPAYIRIYQSYLGQSCPEKTTQDTNFTGATICYVQLAKN